MAVCCICERAVDRWLPHPAMSARSEFMVLMGTVGSDLAVFSCPHCACTDRDRHLWLYMTAVGLPATLRGADILHLAPERALEPLFEACGPASYLRGDLHPSQPHHQTLDAHALPFPGQAFDLIVANHLLEHVRDAAQVLAEFRRCLKPGGILIAQTPYAPRLARTFELLAPVTTEFARLFYGQDDHVRLFGADMESYFRAAGLNGALVVHDALLAGIDGAEFGCNPLEPLFAFSRPVELAQAA